MSAPKTTYRVGEFAVLAGVTVRALHHYDRVGLLCPHRGTGGYRVYSARDLERLEQIVVLRFLGIPLRQIGEMLRASPVSLAGSLRAQHATLAKRRQLLDVAIAAIEDLERAVATGTTGQPQLFKRIIEVIDMQTDPNAWKQEYDELVAKKVERLQALSPDALADLRSRWTTLATEIRGALADDPERGGAGPRGSVDEPPQPTHGPDGGSRDAIHPSAGTGVGPEDGVVRRPPGVGVHDPRAGGPTVI